MRVGRQFCLSLSDGAGFSAPSLPPKSVGRVHSSIPVIKALMLLPLVIARRAGYIAARQAVIPEMLPAMSEITRILSAIEHGDPHAADKLLPLVYDELRRLAAQKLAQEKPGQTLEATALVHEAYLRLVDVDQGQHWDGRAHFFAAAAEAMRRILVESARRRHSRKHGGGRVRQELDSALLEGPQTDDDLLGLDEALTRLAATEPQIAELVKLRYFAGLTVAQAASHLGIAPRTADAWWSYARAWFQVALHDS